MEKQEIKTLFGSSPCLYAGTSYGSKVEGASSMVRQFNVVGETSRSYVLAGNAKAPKKTMEYDTGSFKIKMFASVSDAVAHLSSR